MKWHDCRLDEQGNWGQHQDEAGASFVGPTIVQSKAYTAWPVSGGSTLSFVLDDAGRFVYERPLPSNGGKYLYQHDGFGRLVSAEKRNPSNQVVTTTTYGYTADGRLAWRKEGAAAREWLIYDGSRRWCRRPETQLTWTHVWAGSRLVRSSKRGDPDTVYHPHQDRLGSIVVVTRQGQAAEKKLYDAYGRLVAVPNDHDTTPLSIPFGYAGARWEATAGLYQMGARWYDRELGRFIEQDPIGEAGGLNLYAYVGSSPTLWVDPTGLARESSFKGPSSAGGSRSGMRWEMNGTECSSEQAADYMRMASRRDESRENRAHREAEEAQKKAREAGNEGNSEGGLYSIIVNFKRGATQPRGLELAGTPEERQQSLEQIRGGLPEKDRGHVRVEEGDGSEGRPEGHFFVVVDGDHRSKDKNFRALKQLTNTPGHVVVEQWDPSKPPIMGQDINGQPVNVSEPFMGKILGVTLTTTAMISASWERDAPFSTKQGTVQVYIGPQASEVEGAKSMAHELYGHALPGLLGQRSQHFGLNDSFDQGIRAIHERTRDNFLAGR